jgi:hypothetical protein
MKTSNKFLIIYSILTPLTVLLGFIVTHDFDEKNVVRGVFTHPDSWDHKTEILTANSFNVIYAHYSGLVLTDTVPMNTIVFKYWDERIMPTYSIQNDTLHLWSKYSDVVDSHLGYFFINPDDTLHLLSDEGLVRSIVPKYRNVNLSLYLTNFFMVKGTINKLLINEAKYSRLEIAGDSVIGNLQTTDITINMDSYRHLNIDGTSSIVLRKTPLLNLDHILSASYYDTKWRMGTYHVGKTVKINLTDSTFQAQIPPQ